MRQRAAPIEMANNMVSAMKKIAMIIHVMSAVWWKEDKTDVIEIKFLQFSFNVYNDRVINLIAILHQLCMLQHLINCLYIIMTKNESNAIRVGNELTTTTEMVIELSITLETQLIGVTV